MSVWKRDLYVLTACQFIVQAGFSLIMPFLPLFIAQDLGVADPKHVQLYAGLVFSANFATAALVSPLWGRLADRKGRKPMMLRSTFGMAVVVSLIGLAKTPGQLLFLRALQGIVAGFIPASVAYMASRTPKQHTGFALGFLQTGGTAGNVIGPLIGGALARVLGYRTIFHITALSCLAAGLVVLLVIRENFKPGVAAAGAPAPDAGWRLLRHNPILLAMWVVIFLTMLSLMTAEPILSLYLGMMQTAPEHITLLSGLIFSASGMANIFSAPLLGRLGDRHGYRRVLLVTLVGSALAYALQGLAASAWELLAYRFVLGLFIGGTLPAANALVAQAAPPGTQGRAFGLTTAAMFVGNTIGPLVGSGVAYVAGLRAVFFATALIRMVNVVWVARAVPVPRAATRAEPAASVGQD